MGTNVGIGLVAGPHPTVANLWVRENDPTNDNLMLTGVVKGVPGTQAGVYSHGCVLTQVDGTTSLSAQWENVGTSALPAWQRWATI